MKKFTSATVLAFTLTIAASTFNFPLSASAESKGAPAQASAPVEAKDVVDIAVGSKDHKTLATAVTKADLVEVLRNPGPFTVFAPTDVAFGQLPAGTVDNLLKPENKMALQNILQYHVSVGVFTEALLKDGLTINQANGDDIKVGMKDGKITINGAKILGTVRGSNGIVHVIDTVLLPPEKKAS